MACSANCWAVSRKTRNAIAVELQGRLQVVEQVHFSQVLLRTLQRRVQQWVRHHNRTIGSTPRPGQRRWTLDECRDSSGRE